MHMHSVYHNYDNGLALAWKEGGLVIITPHECTIRGNKIGSVLCKGKTIIYSQSYYISKYQYSGILLE